MQQFLVSFFLFLFCLHSYGQQTFVSDTPFWQEYHEAYPVGAGAGTDQVKSIAVDAASTVWIATEAGIFKRDSATREWSNPFTTADNGPAYCVRNDNNTGLWIGTWNGVYLSAKNGIKKISGTEGPVSVLCLSREGIYALGPKGVWLFNGTDFTRKNYPIARSVRDAISDKQGGLWVASDVGLYHCSSRETRHFYANDLLISAAVKQLSLDDRGRLWAGGLGGVTVLENREKIKAITPKQGCPSIYVYAVRQAPDKKMWVGTESGIVRFDEQGRHSLRFSRRWLMNDHVNDIAFDKEGTAWIATAGGVSAIRKRKMTLSSKADFFYDILMKRHIRAPWIAGQARLSIPGDIHSWHPDDDDNDGEFTANYLAQESFRYATTRDDDAKQKARKAFDFLKMLQDVTGSGGYFARTIVPSVWKYPLHDSNITYTARQLADELVKEPRFKPVEERWRKSADGKWLWKGDASSDEMCGHMMGYFFYFELVADSLEKKRVAAHIASIVDHLIANDYNIIDVDGTHTRWSVWSPALLNRDPEWTPDRSQNSMEMLTFLKLAGYVTGSKKYEEHYLKLIHQEHYLENMKHVKDQNPAWFVYFDVILQAYLYPILLHCEKDPQLLAFYKRHLEEWMAKRKKDNNPLVNFLYTYAARKTMALKDTYNLLVDAPLDLIDWNIDHSKREDIRLVHEPVLDEWQTSELPPASIRATIRWDRNPWNAVGGSGDIEREPVYWLLPYWMGRYLKEIR